MIDFLLFIFAGVGITNLVVNASVLNTPRNFLTSRSSFMSGLLECMMCSGFWVGIVLGLSTGVNPILAGPTVSLISFVFSYLVELVELEIASRREDLEDRNKVDF